VPVPTPRDKTREANAPRADDPPAIADRRQRMGSAPAKTIHKQRAATAECANAQARNRGLRQFVVRGRDKVRSVTLWHALTHNMVCTWRLTAAGVAARPLKPMQGPAARPREYAARPRGPLAPYPGTQAPQRTKAPDPGGRSRITTSGTATPPLPGRAMPPRQSTNRYVFRLSVVSTG